MSTSKHIIVDYKITGHVHLSNIETAHLFYQIMLDAVKTTDMVVVNSSCNILGEDGKSPLGFSNVLSLNTSHFTLHNYYDKKTFSLDCYTCGNTDPQILVDYFERKVQSLIESRHKFSRANSYIMNERVKPKPILRRTNYQQITRHF